MYARICTRARTTPDIPWLNMYRNEINKEIHLMLDPTSSILTDYCFIRDTRRLLDIQVVTGLADSLLFPISDGFIRVINALSSILDIDLNIKKC